MRTSRAIIAIGATALILAVVVAVSIPMLRHWPKNVPVIDPRTVTEAVTRFANDCREKGRPVPPTITLGELVAGGFLRADFTNGLVGMDFTLHTNANEENPQSILMDVRFPDGNGQLLLGDGSVQQVTETRRREALRDAAQAARSR